MPDTSAAKPSFAQCIGGQRPIVVRALLLGERMVAHATDHQEPLARTPLTIAVHEGGVAVLFRYGVVVLINVSRDGEKSLLGRLSPLIIDPFSPQESDEVRLEIRPETDDQIDVAGGILLKDVTVERLQLVADILAKNLILSHYESSIAVGFDRIEPMAETLRRRGKLGIGGRPLLRQIGTALIVQHKMVGRVETSEKPDLLWDHPEIERLYARLAEEYELRDRARALDHKQDVILRTSEIMLGLVQERSNLRVEWYVLLLIVAELIATIYSLIK